MTLAEPLIARQHDLTQGVKFYAKVGPPEVGCQPGMWVWDATFWGPGIASLARLNWRLTKSLSNSIHFEGLRA